MTAKEQERLAALEAQVAMICKKQDEHSATLREVRDAVVAARGAKWVVITLISVSGVVGGLLSSLLPLSK